MERSNISRPAYEIRATNFGPEDLSLSVWQMPCPATPHLARPVRVAGLRGRNLSLVGRQVLGRLHAAGVDVAPTAGERRTSPVDEETALVLGLLFRLLAPMRDAGRMRTVATRMESMDLAEASYWMGMAMHRKRPRKVLRALRIILTDTED